MINLRKKSARYGASLGFGLIRFLRQAIFRAGTGVRLEEPGATSDALTAEPPPTPSGVLSLLLDSRVSPEAAGRQLSELSQRFAERRAQTEQEFVELARTLRSLYSTATELAGLVSSRAGALRSALSESRIAGPEGLATRTLQRLRSGLEDNSKLLQALQKVESSLRRLELHVGNMKRSGAFLKYLVLGFAVESSRTPECQKAFGTFVEELRALAARIDGVWQSVGQEVRNTRSSQANGLKSIGSSVGEMRKLSERLEITAGATAVEAQRLLDGALVALQQAEEHARQIAGHADEAVYHLQFGDIVRQKFEHIVAALQEAGQRLIIGDRAGKVGDTAEAADRVIAIQVGQLEFAR
jgi:ferritin-like metal-binding protein YciE